MKLKILALAVVMFTAVSTAQSGDADVDPDPGLVKADSPLYGLEVAVDNAFVTAGLASPGEVAFERASEAAVARDRNNTRATVNALDRFNSAVNKSNNRDLENLQRAESILSNVSEVFPDQAEYGISTALENLESAKQRVPDRLTSDRNDSGALPDLKLPGGPETDVEPPVETKPEGGAVEADEG